MDDDAGVGIDVGELEELRIRAERAKELEELNASLQRDLALQRAGVDTNSEAGRIFARGYDGELTPEAIRTQAQGFFQRSTHSDEVVAQERMQQAAQAPPVETVDPHSLIQQASSAAEVMELAGKFNWPTVHNRPA